MLEDKKHLALIVIGFTLLLGGWLLSLLMVIDAIQRSIYLSLLSYAISLAGLGLSIYGFAGYFGVKIKRKARSELKVST
jgi:hypothetical protein